MNVEIVVLNCQKGKNSVSMNYKTQLLQSIDLGIWNLLQNGFQQKVRFTVCSILEYTVVFV